MAGSARRKDKKIRAIIQARMSSSRFPGKVLAPFKGRPLIAHVIENIERAVPRNQIVLATSGLPSDDPLVSYVETLGAAVYRGALDNVVKRFQDCVKKYPCDWFFRVCADSPLLDSKVFKTMISHASRTDLDLVTNVFPRTFPRGQSAEMLLTSTFLKIDASRLSPEEKEHVTKHYYENSRDFRILNIKSDRPANGSVSLAVDTFEDLARLEG